MTNDFYSCILAVFLKKRLLTTRFFRDIMIKYTITLIRERKLQHGLNKNRKGL